MGSIKKEQIKNLKLKSFDLVFTKILLNYLPYSSECTVVLLVGGDFVVVCRCRAVVPLVFSVLVVPSVVGLVVAFVVVVGISVTVVLLVVGDVVVATVVVVGTSVIVVFSVVVVVATVVVVGISATVVFSVVGDVVVVATVVVVGTSVTVVFSVVGDVVVGATVEVDVVASVVNVSGSAVPESESPLPSTSPAMSPRSRLLRFNSKSSSSKKRKSPTF